MLYEGNHGCAQQVLLVCDSAYRLLRVEGHHCHLSLTYGTPIACSEEVVAKGEALVKRS